MNTLNQDRNLFSIPNLFKYDFALRTLLQNDLIFSKITSTNDTKRWDIFVDLYSAYIVSLFLKKCF